MRKDFETPRRLNRAYMWIAVLSLAILLPLSAIAQVVTASLRGTVTDPSGSSVANASVKALNTSTNVVTEANTDENGRFVLASLEPGGPYTLTITAPGFKVEQRTGITLAVSQISDLNIPLQVGSTSETVEVQADVSQIETSTGTISGLVENRSIVNLPLNQRNPYALVFLLPGSTGSVGTAYNSANISINGGRPGSMDILVDGIPASPPLANPIQGFAVFPSVDAVDEFKVLASGYSAEFGRSGSGILNLILKSGTNHPHGSLYDFVRNSAMDANSWFNKHNNKPLPNFSRNQFGGSLTGPVVFPHLYNGKDKTFFLFSYEGLRQGTGTSTNMVVPTAAQRQGDFSETGNPTIYDPTTTVPNGSGGYKRTAFAGNIIPKARLDPVAQNIVKYWPMPNVPGAAYGANNYFATGVSQVNINTYDAKVDEVFNERNRMFVRYSGRRLTQPATLYEDPSIAIAQNNAGSQPQNSNSVAVDYTRSQTPTLVFEARYGYSRIALDFRSVSDGFDPTQLGFPSSIAAAADHLQFPGISPANYTGLGSAGQGTTRHAGYEAHLLGVNITKVTGNHVLKFGGEGRLMRANDTESGNSVGGYQFPKTNTQLNPNNSAGGDGFASFMLGLGTGTMTIDSKNGATQSFYYALYAQDDWKPTTKLTLNLGLRWDVDIPRTERHNRMEVFDPSATSPLASIYPPAKGGIVFMGVNGVSRRQYNPQWANFSPRISFAYQVNTNTVVRGAYGIYFAPSLRAAAATIGSVGFSASTAFNAIPGVTPSGATLSNPFPNGIATPVGNSQGLLTGIGQGFATPLAGDNRVGYVQNYNLDVQRQLPWSTIVDVAYVGSHGVHLNKSGESDYQLNQLPIEVVQAQKTALQQTVPNPFYNIIKTGPLSAPMVPRSYLLAPYPQYLSIQASYLTGGFSQYDSVQVKVTKRTAHGLSLLLAFTGQKLFDNYSNISNVGNQAGGIQDIYNPIGDRSVSSNDVSHKLVVSGVYELPFGRGKRFGSNWNRAVDVLLGGWQSNGIYTQQSGFPLAITTQNTSQAGGNVLRPNVTGADPFTKGPISQRLGFAGHNSGGGYINSAAFVQPAPFTFGNAPRTISNLRAPSYENVDFSLFKNFVLKEEMKLQIRAESFNTLNQVVFGSPVTNLANAQFGVISSTANSPRQIQFAAKLLF